MDINNTNNTFINKTECIDVVMPVYNLLEYSENYSMTSGTWKVEDDANENNAFN